MKEQNQNIFFGFIFLFSEKQFFSTNLFSEFCFSSFTHLIESKN